MFLVDTNVISEARKGEAANPGVRAFFRAADPAACYLAVQTIGEIRRGLENLALSSSFRACLAIANFFDIAKITCHHPVPSVDGARCWLPLNQLSLSNNGEK